MEKIMSKGEKLGTLLDKSDALDNQMNQIFIKQGLYTPDLSLLSPIDQEEWNRIHEQSKVLTAEICKLING